MSALNENEKEFIEGMLSDSDDVEVESDDETLSVVKKSKKSKKKNKVPPYKKLSNWIAAIFILPFLATGVFLIGLFRVEAYMGKESLEWIAQQEITPEVKEIASEAGFDWLPAFLEIYSNRGIIIAITFAIPLAIVAGLIIYDVKKENKRNEEAQDEEV